MDEAEYQRAMDEFSALFLTNPHADSPKGKRLLILAELIGVYEAELFADISED